MRIRIYAVLCNRCTVTYTGCVAGVYTLFYRRHEVAVRLRGARPSV